MDDVPQYLLEVRQAYRLSDWLYMKEGGVRVPGNAMFRQNKAIYERLCNLLGLPADGNKPALISRVKSYEFTSEQLEEMRQFEEAKRAAREAALTQERVNRRLDALEAGPRPYDHYTYAVMRFHGRGT